MSLVDHDLGSSDDEPFFEGNHTGRLSMASILSDESGPPPLNEIVGGDGGGTGKLSLTSVFSDDSNSGPPPLNEIATTHATYDGSTSPPGPPPTSISASMLQPVIFEEGLDLDHDQQGATMRSFNSFTSMSSQRFEARAAGASDELAAFGAMLNEGYDDLAVAGLTELHL